MEEINIKFERELTHEEEIISLGGYNEDFGDYYLGVFSKVGWEKIIELNLNNNNITTIETLYNMQLLFLEKLDLSNNNISEIDDIHKLQAINLKSVNFYKNKIEDPFGLYDDKFNGLEYLNLLENEIDDKDKEKFKKKFTKKHKEDIDLTLEI